MESHSIEPNYENMNLSEIKIESDQNYYDIPIKEEFFSVENEQLSTEEEFRYETTFSENVETIDVKPTIFNIDNFDHQNEKNIDYMNDSEMDSDEDFEETERTHDEYDDKEKKEDILRDLIKEVQKRPLLYDNTLQNEDNSTIEKLWTEVAEQLNSSVTFCQLTWDSLTYRYNKITEKQILNGKSKFQWKYLDDMFFYLSFCTKDDKQIIENENEQFQRKLIETVRDEYSELYDLDHPAFTRNARKRILTWYKVAEDLNCSAEKCRREWNRLRFVFSSKYALRTSGKKFKANSFDGLMKFLIPYIGLSEQPRVKPQKELDDENFKRKLSKIVQEYPQIYVNPYSRLHDRFQLWDEISNKIGVDANKCRKTWGFLRHHYTGILRRRKMGLIASWKFEKDLEFLMPYLIESSLKYKKEIEERKVDNSNFRHQIIAAVKNFRVLYDLNNFALNTKERKNSWQKIAKELGHPIETCKHSWSRLKKTYRKLIIFQLKGGKREWEYENEMEFLKPYIILKKNIYTKELETMNQNNSDRKESVESRKQTMEAPIQKTATDKNNENEYLSDNKTSSKTDSFLQNEKFIRFFLRILQKYPNLYSHYDEHNMLLNVDHELSWRQLAKEVNCSTTDCVKIWKRLKQVYRQKDFKRNIHLGKWIYEDDLAFAKSFILSKSYTKQKCHEDEENYKDPNFRRKLIEVVKKYPAIYDSSNENYNNAQYLNKDLWPKIANKLNYSIKGCHGLWSYLVLTYKETILSKHLNGDFSSENKMFEFSKEMEFLEPYIKADNEKAVHILCNKNETFRDNLIQIVKKYPSIYDYNHSDYRKNVIKILWQNIAGELKTTDTKCRAEWSNLRKKYHEIVEQKNPAEINEMTKFEKDMEFIKPFLSGKRKKKDEKTIEKSTKKDEYRFKLIKMIKSFPQIYNPKYMTTSCGGSKQQQSNIWKKVANQLGCTVEKCRKDWKLLKRKLKLIHKQKEMQSSKWKFKDQMQFMIPLIEEFQNVFYKKVNQNIFLCKMEHFQQKLISEIKKYPILYKDKEKNVKDTWITVAKEMNRIPRVCRWHWRILKTNYRDFLLQKMKDTKITWNLAKDMEFLLNVEDVRFNDYQFKLIEIVKKYPQLYDPNCMAVDKSKKLKTILWDKVSKEMAQKAEKCYNDWEHLKREFKNFYTSNPEQFTAWKFIHSMKFTVSFIEKELENTNNKNATVAVDESVTEDLYHPEKKFKGLQLESDLYKSSKDSTSSMNIEIPIQVVKEEKSCALEEIQQTKISNENEMSPSKKSKPDDQKVILPSENIKAKFMKFADAVDKLPMHYQNALKEKINEAISKAQDKMNKNLLKETKENCKGKNVEENISKNIIPKYYKNRKLVVRIKRLHNITFQGK